MIYLNLIILFILGLKYKSGFIRGEKETIIFTSYQDPKSDFKNFRISFLIFRCI